MNDNENENKRPIDQAANAAALPPGVGEDEDFYMDGPYCVFTAAFHLKRGFCCASGCRHCPYKDDPDSPEPTP